jgi:hypothetical protein
MARDRPNLNKLASQCISIAKRMNGSRKSICESRIFSAKNATVNLSAWRSDIARVATALWAASFELFG